MGMWQSLRMQGAPESLEYRLFFKQKGAAAALKQMYSYAITLLWQTAASCLPLPSCTSSQCLRSVDKLGATCLLMQCRRGHLAVARHPAAGQGRHLQLRVRDPQGDGRQDGGRHGRFRTEPGSFASK
jgi:hypothetical protein